MLLSSNGRHRAVKPRRTSTQRLIAGAGIAGVVGLALPMAGATSAIADANTSSTAAASTSSSTVDATTTAAVTSATTSSTSTSAASDYYTVVAGDWLSTIAENKDVSGGWERLYQLNKSTLTQGPNVIYPGERLRLSGSVVASSSSVSDDSSSDSSSSDSNSSDASSSSSSDSSSSSSSTDASSTTSSSSSSSTSTGMAAAIAFAEAQLGKEYVYGGTGPDSWDCSGLAQAALAQAGISIPRTSEEQAAAATPVSMDALEPGDLLFWSSDGTAAGAYHVAIYVGNGEYVEAANPSAGVKTDTISDYTPSFAGRF